MNKKVIVGAVIIAALLIGGIVWAVMQPTMHKAGTAQFAITKVDDTQKPAATMTYGDDGFAPQAVTIQTNEWVKVTNTTRSTLELVPGEHSASMSRSELNIEAIPAGKSRTFQVMEKGSWTFHDHMNTEHTGTLTVK